MTRLRAQEKRRKMALESAKASEVEVGEQSKPAPFNIDDPQNINSFLTAMKISIASPQPEPAHNTISQNAPTTESSELADAMGASEVSA